MLAAIQKGDDFLVNLHNELAAHATKDQQILTQRPEEVCYAIILHSREWACEIKLLQKIPNYPSNTHNNTFPIFNRQKGHIVEV